MRAAVISAATALGAAVSAAPALGHAVVQPPQARPADPQIYRLTVPNEGASPVVDVRLRVPRGIDFALVETPPAGWTGRIVRRGDAISEIRWSGGRIAPEGYAVFRFLVRNPVEEGEVAWPAVQRYADGQVQRWIGPPGSDEPASRTRISERAVPQEIVAVNGERIAAAQGAGGTPRPAASGTAPAPQAGRDALTLGVAIAGLLAGLAGLAAALRRGQTV